MKRELTQKEINKMTDKQLIDQAKIDVDILRAESMIYLDRLNELLGNQNTIGAAIDNYECLIDEIAYIKRWDRVIKKFKVTGVIKRDIQLEHFIGRNDPFLRLNKLANLVSVRMQNVDTKSGLPQRDLSHDPFQESIDVFPNAQFGYESAV